MQFPRDFGPFDEFDDGREASFLYSDWIQKPFRGIVLALGENRGAGEAAMRFRLTFICREPGCDKTAVVLYDARPGETVQQFRQRNPTFLAVFCGAKHAGNYPASTAIDITVPAQSN